MLQVMFLSAALLEVFDFPPIWGHFDAHSLWHACTAPLGFMWYAWWEEDAVINCNYNASQRQAKNKDEYEGENENENEDKPKRE